MAVLAAESNTVIGLWAGLAALAGVILTTVVNQWNKRRDDRKADKEKNIQARVADTEAALRAWDKINNFQAEQITNLTARVNDLEQRIEAYEGEVVPQLQGVINELRAQLNIKQATINEQQAQIAALLARIDELQSGGKDH